MRVSPWRGVIAWLAVLGMLTGVLGAARTAHGQCIGGMCPTRPYDDGGGPSVPSGHYSEPRPSVCRIRLQIGVGSSLGTGTLVCVGADYGAVITCAHLFREGAGQITVTFRDGKTFSGELAAQDPAGELAIVKITPRPEIPIVRIAADHPQQGERLTFGGYGPDGRYREVTGVLNGYRGTAGGGHQTLEVQGSARQGDSGGPIFNAQGELAGVLWGTDGSTTVGSYNGRICQFTQVDRYLFPWNADLAKEKYRQQNPPEGQPLAPPTSPGSPIGDEVREKLASLEKDVQSLGRDVATLQGIADAAKQAAAKAETEAGKAFAEAVGVKSDAERAASAATVAQHDATAAKETAEKVDQGLLERVGGLVQKTAVGLLTRYGGWSLAVASVVVGLVIWLVRKDILDKIRNGDPLLIEKLAARTSNVLDDRIASLVAGAIERLAPSPEPAAASRRQTKAKTAK
jgi:hypothetical protein